MDNDCSNNRGFVCEHGDDLTCSSPSHHQQVLESLWADSSHRPSFHDPSSSSPPTAYFDMPAPLHRNTRRRPRGRPVIHSINEEHNELVPEETNTNPEANCSYESSSQVISGKKRRLTAEQVQFLERSFELENKLDPDRKSRLARELGLEPRQVAIWFQNRRARFKTKSIEKEFDGLRNRYDKLKDEYETVLKENEQLQDQVSVLTAKLKRTKTSDSTPSPLHNNYTNTDAAITHLTPVVLFKSAKVKQEEAATSAKSDVLDSDSSPPRCSGGDGVAAKCNYYNNYYYNSSSPVPEMVEEEESEEFQLTRSLFPPAPPPAPYDGFHRQDGGCNGFGMSTAGVDVEVEPRPSSLWPWLY